MKPIGHAVALIAALLLCACGGGGGGGPAGTAAAPPPQVGRTESITLASQDTQATYAVNVYLPAQYDASANRTFPVIYALDGDAAFGYPGNVTRFDALMQVLQSRGTPAILVGIGGTARRNTDFLPPGSVAYHAFIANQLVPAIELRYRADPARRILSGLSNGGTFVFLAFLYEGTGTFVFKQFWSTEIAPTFADGVDQLGMESALAAAVGGRALPVTLFFAGATSSNGPLVDKLYTQMLSHHYVGLDLEEVLYGNGTTHVGADIPAFTEALMRFLP